MVRGPRVVKVLPQAFYVVEFRRHCRFGLVFEQPIPETTALLGYPLRPGATVRRRNDPAAKQLYRVLDVKAEALLIGSLDGKGDTEICAANELLAVQRIGESIFPGLTSVGKVDVLHLDPPYNTGAKDWKYNKFDWPSKRPLTGCR